MSIIYGLRDPLTKDIRYIGKSTIGLKRPRSHANRALKGERGHKANWIRTLQAMNLTYEIVVLEEVPEDKLNEREVFWIAQYRPLGKLTNISSGGLNEADQRAGGKARWAKLTPEQRSALAREQQAKHSLEYHQERSRLMAKFDTRTLEQRREHCRIMTRKRMESISPEVISEYCRKNALAMSALLTKEELDARLSKMRASITPEGRKEGGRKSGEARRGRPGKKLSFEKRVELSKKRCRNPVMSKYNTDICWLLVRFWRLQLGLSMNQLASIIGNTSFQLVHRRETAALRALQLQEAA